MASILISVQLQPSFVLTMNECMNKSIRSHPSFYLTRVHHHSPLAAWSLSSLPLVFPLMEHRRRCCLLNQTSDERCRIPLSLFHPPQFFTPLLLVVLLLLLPLQQSNSRTPSRRPSFWSVPLCVPLHSPAPFESLLCLDVTINQQERSQSCARKNGTRSRTLRDKDR